MIVRIATEGQYRLGGVLLEKLNQMDNQLVEVITNSNDKEYQILLASMLNLVRNEGEPVPIDELVESDLILPAPDTTLDEARRYFQGDGLLPG